MEGIVLYWEHFSCSPERTRVRERPRSRWNGRRYLIGPEFSHMALAVWPLRIGETETEAHAEDIFEFGCAVGG
jgi:hypothetical protein